MHMRTPTWRASGTGARWPRTQQASAARCEVSALVAQAAFYLALLNLTSIFDLRLLARKIISGRLIICTHHVLELNF